MTRRRMVHLKRCAAKPLKTQGNKQRRHAPKFTIQQHMKWRNSRERLLKDDYLNVQCSKENSGEYINTVNTIGENQF